MVRVRPRLLKQNHDCLSRTLVVRVGPWLLGWGRSLVVGLGDETRVLVLELLFFAVFGW